MYFYTQNNTWKTVLVKGISIYYQPTLDGGGMDMGQDLIPIAKELFGTVDHVCEFASGPGFVGFSFLAEGLCRKLTLIDVNPDAIKACKKTIDANGLNNRVTVLLSDGLKDVPNSAKWDLVISNPPHINGSADEYKSDIINIDPGWKIHKEFYAKISKHLVTNGSILFSENAVGSSPKLWKKLIEKNKLSFKRIIWYEPKIYQRFIRCLKMSYKVAFIHLAKYFLYHFIIAVLPQYEARLKNKIYPYYFVFSQK